jgi:ectoine hydroxylase-related dioxygenase (phytanoyl-CoA dioxygenase family)|tara:strand:- start:1646 stop:2389 length:744 start_codon:yes stop_codon:yes gene_type:complete
LANGAAKISSKNVKEFRSQGFLIIENFVSMETLLGLRRASKRIVQNYKKGAQRSQPPEQSRHYGNISKLGRMFLANQSPFHAELQSYLKSTAIKQLTTQLLGKNVFLFNEQFVIKEPDARSSFNWHQDSGYIDFEHKPYLSTWLALDDTNASNGALSIIPTRLDKSSKAILHQWSEISKDLSIEIDEGKARTFYVAAGTLIAFSSLTPHASASNNSSSPRTAFLAQFSSEPIIDPATGLNRNKAVPI